MTMNNIKSDKEIFLSKEVTTLIVELSWKQKEGSRLEHLKGLAESMMMGASEKSFDLNLAAILEYSDEKKPELIFHNKEHSSDSNSAVLLGKDRRTGSQKGINETIKINMINIPYSAKRITLFTNISEGNALKQHFTDIKEVFVQILNGESHKLYWCEEDAFKSEEAEENCSFAFAEIVPTENGWILRKISNFSKYDSEVDFYNNFIENI